MTRIGRHGFEALLVAAALCGCGDTQAKASFITTLPSWNGSDSVTPFGEGYTATYGQTVAVGSDNVLDSFSFRLIYSGGSGPVDFAAYVMAWDGWKATGPVLFQSSMQSLSPSQNTYHTFNINTGGITLSSGSQYVLFLSTSNNFDGTPSFASMGFVPDSDSYAGGSFVFMNNESNFGDLSTTNWAQFGFGDAAFTADFSSENTVNTIATPAPPAAALFAVGLMGLAGFRRLRGKREVISAT